MNQLSRHGMPWTEDETNRLIEYANSGTPVNEIAQQLGRSVGAIHAKLDDLIDKGIHVAVIKRSRSRKDQKFILDMLYGDRRYQDYEFLS